MRPSANPTPYFRRTSTWFALVSMTFLSSSAWGQLPVAQLNSVFPNGAKAGTTVEVTLAGTDLEQVQKLHFSHDGLSAQPKMADPKPWENGPQVVENQFVITIKPDVPAGIYEVRTVGQYGVSNPRAFVVGSLNEVAETEPNNQTAQAQELQLPVVVNGRSNNNSDLDHFKFAAKKGQRLIIDCWAQRIDSRMDPTLVLFNEQGDEVERNRDANYRDPLIDYTIPADGTYTLKLYDFLYQGNADYFYRLSVGELPYVDLILPPAGLPGSKGNYTIYGRNLPGGKPSDKLSVDGRPLEQVTVEIQLPDGEQALDLRPGTLSKPAETGLDGTFYRLPTPLGLANPVLVGFATAPVLAEVEPNNDEKAPQKITVPCELYGQFHPERDKDWYSFEAKKGEVFIVEIMSQRMGLVTDPFLRVVQVTKSDKGEQLRDLQAVDDVNVNIGGQDFDTRSDDPQYRFAAPADGEYRVLVRDLYSGSRGDPRYVYRLAIRPEQPDFRLVAVASSPRQQRNQNGVQWSPMVRRGGTELIDVMIFRRDGFNEEVTVTAEGLPPGVTCPPIVIGSTMNSNTLVFKADENAKAWAGTIRITGKAKVADKELVRTARGGTITWPGQQNNFGVEARLMRNIVLSVSEVEMAPFLVELDRSQPWETCKNGKLEIPVKVTRRDDFKGNVALTAVNLPQNVQVANLTINADKTDGKLQVTLNQNSPLGTFSLYVQGTSQVPYKYNPQGAELAAEFKKIVDQKVNELNEANKKAAADKAAADKAVADAAAAVKKANDELAAADKTLAAATKAQQDAQAALAKAEEALAKEKDNAGLLKAKEDAQKALSAAEAKTKEATDAKTAAADRQKTANDQAKAAAEAKPIADKAATDAANMLKEAQAAQAASNKRATDLANNAKPKNRNVFDPSTTVDIKITDSPITLATSAPSFTVKQGEKVEIPVKTQRLYGFEDTVNLDIRLPGGVNGLKINKVNIDKGKADANLSIEAAANATPGSHTLTIRGTSRFNNQNMDTDITFTLVVEAVEAKK